MNILKSILIFSTAMLGITAMANTGLGFNQSTASGLNISKDASSVYTIVTTNTDPHVKCDALSAALPFGDAKLQFQYQASADVDDLQLFFCDPETEARSIHAGAVLKKTDVWQTATINIACAKNSFSWGSAGNILRMDFGNKSGITIKIRYMGINGSETPSDATKNTQSAAIAQYLSTTYPAEITDVKVTENKVIITGKTVADGCKLIDIRAYGTSAPLSNFADVANLPKGNFTIEKDRYIAVEGFTYDRLLSKWAVTDAGYSIQSHARYSDEVAAIRHAQPGVFKSKKGLGGIFNVNLGDIDNLGLHSVTFNTILNAVISINKTSDYTIPYEYCGKTYYINPTQQDYNDMILKTCEQKGVVVAAIILINDGGDPQYATTMRHPECSGGFYTMPDMTDIEGMHAYAASISYLADRYSQTGNGRIHHWIMHNEVDQHRTWTNMGSTPLLLRYMDAYQKSLRLTSNIVRQYDPNAYVLGSYTSCWTGMNGDGGYQPKTMMDLMVTYGNVEGDYRWGIADHPYPQDFFKPKFWIEDTNATYDESAGSCTFKNIEVISDWVLRREHYYKGTEKRILLFSENGVNSMDNSEANLKIQAAGACWAWKKVKRNAGVDAIMWHNWFDHPAEAADGVRLGLKDSNLNPKRSWYVWQAAGTATEEAVFDEYKSVIGISSWDQIHAGVAKNGNEWQRFNLDTSTASGIKATYDGNYQCYTLVTTNTDPQILTDATTAALSTNSNVLAFDYQSDKDFTLQIFFSPFASEERSIKVPLKATSSWQRTYVDIAAMRNVYTWGAAGSQLRIDVGNASGITAKLRHLCVNSGEIESHAVLGITSDGANKCTVTGDNSGAYTAVTSGSDPNFYSTKLPANLKTDANKLIFEYQSSTTLPTLQFYFVDYAGELRSVKVSNVPATTEWTQMVVDISNIVINHGWGFEGDYIRIDPGDAAGITFKIRGLKVNNGEFTSDHILIIDNQVANDLSLSRDYNPEPYEADLAFGPQLLYNSWAINTTGSDPYTLTNPLEINLNEDATKLHFEYKSTAAVEPLELFYLRPETAYRSRKYSGKMPAAADWTKVVVDIEEARKAFGWGYTGDVLRIDLGNIIGSSIQLRKISINNNAEQSTDVQIVETGGWAVYGTVGGAVIVSDTKQSFDIFNVAGVLIRRIDAQGQTFVSLSPGIYIIGGKKVAVR